MRRTLAAIAIILAANGITTTAHATEPIITVGEGTLIPNIPPGVQLDMIMTHTGNPTERCLTQYHGQYLRTTRTWGRFTTLRCVDIDY